MQRSYPLRWLALAIGLLGTQCLDSISDDCTKTLTCEVETPALGPDCIWRYSDGRQWTKGPQYDTATKLYHRAKYGPTAHGGYMPIEQARRLGGRQDPKYPG